MNPQELQNEVKSHLSTFEQVLNSKEFDESEVTALRFSSDSVTLYYRTKDDFQKELPEDQKYYNGYYMHKTEPNIEELYVSIGRIPSRSQRELHILAAQAAAFGKVLSGLQDEQCRVFAKELLQDVESLRNLLTDMRGE